MGETLDLDEVQMRSWGERLGRRLAGGDVVLLDGPMGSGKTTLTRAIAAGVGVARPRRVCSPTYTVCMIHPGDPLGLVHVDLFRLGEDAGPLGAAAFEALGLDYDELPGPQRVMVVEWAQLWSDPPARHLRIVFDGPGGDGLGADGGALGARRRFHVRASGPDWARVFAP